jgi:hypothetical protein
MIDHIYVAASAHDARYTRICVASVRYFYPDIPIKLLAGGPLTSGLATELRYYWNVGVADLPVGDYGWGFVKLEPLFGQCGERFLILDSDTVMAGPVLDLWGDADAAFLVNDETQTEEDTRQLYYDWRLARQFDPKAQPPRFVFNTGQWFGTRGILTREDFGPWVEWTMPRRLRHPAAFMPGDQGVLNYIVNRKAAFAGLDVRRCTIMHWPKHGMDALNVANVAGGTAPPVMVHWAGLKKSRFADMPGAGLLRFFEKLYFQRLPAGSTRRFVSGSRYTFSHLLRTARVRARLASRKLAILVPRQ